MRTRTRGIDTGLRRLIHEELQRYKLLEKLVVKDRQERIFGHKDIYRSMQIKFRKMFAKSCGYEKSKINLFNMLVRNKRIEKMRIEDYLSSLKSRRDFIVQHRKSQKSIIRTLLQDLKKFARRIEDISTTFGFFPEDLERSIVEEYGTSANKSLRMNNYVRRMIRDIDSEIEQSERMIALF